MPVIHVYVTVTEVYRCIAICKRFVSDSFKASWSPMTKPYAWRTDTCGRRWGWGGGRGVYVSHHLFVLFGGVDVRFVVFGIA